MKKSIYIYVYNRSGSAAPDCMQWVFSLFVKMLPKSVWVDTCPWNVVVHWNKKIITIFFKYTHIFYSKVILWNDLLTELCSYGISFRRQFAEKTVTISEILTVESDLFCVR